MLNPEHLPEWFFDRIGTHAWEELTDAERTEILQHLPAETYQEMHLSALALQEVQVLESESRLPMVLPSDRVRSLWLWKSAAAMALLLAAGSLYWSAEKQKTALVLQRVVCDTLVVSGPVQTVRDTVWKVVKEVQIRLVPAEQVCPQEPSEWLAEALPPPRMDLAGHLHESRVEGKSMAGDSLEKKIGFVGL